MELAFLVAIQRLPGRQRAVLILRDVLGWTAPEAAALLETSVAAVNSALQRARATVDGELPPPVAPAAAEQELLRRYVAAWERTDIDGLVALLREDAVMRMPPQPAVRAAAIGRFLGERIAAIRPRATTANGRPAIVMQDHGVMVLEVTGGAITALDVVIDPVLARWFRTV
jgi:RNA polymerase sigma-70 factor (ECF subfamily)